jgi:hypothetical protein
MLATMNEKERKTTLGKLLAMFAEAVDGAVRALEARHARIAGGIVDRLGELVGDIEQAVAAGDYAPSVSYQLKCKLAELRTKGEAFSGAVKLGGLTESRTIGKWLKDYCDELAELAGIE